MMNTYDVINQGLVVGSFNMFFDAWLFATLSFASYCIIKENEDSWVINPKNAN